MDITLNPPPLIAGADVRFPELEATSQIVSAYIGHHAMSPTDVPQFIAQVYGAVARLSAPAAPVEPEAKQEPAVPIRKRFTDTHIICLDDGQQFKSLKRHLRTLGMTPDQYRAKWNLPKDDPIVHPSYSAVRSRLARDNGLGTKKGA